MLNTLIYRTLSVRASLRQAGAVENYLKPLDCAQEDTKAINLHLRIRFKTKMLRRTHVKYVLSFN